MGSIDYIDAESPYILEFQVHDDLRGRLVAFEFAQIPFEIKRFFCISVADNRMVRGQHAHKLCWQLFSSVKDECYITTKNTLGQQEFVLTQNLALVVPPYNWCEIKFQSTNSNLNVFASHPYDSNDYIFSIPKLKGDGL